MSSFKERDEVYRVADPGAFRYLVSFDGQIPG